MTTTDNPTLVSTEFVRRHYSKGPTAYSADGSIAKMPTAEDVAYCERQFDVWLAAHDAEKDARIADLEAERKRRDAECAIHAGGSEALAARDRAAQAASPQQKVKDFHVQLGFAVDAGFNSPNEVRLALLAEEYREYVEAEDAHDPVAIADALGDMLYVIYGTAVTYGLDLDAVVAEIHRSNMTKEASATGKAVKGPGYSPPDLAPLVVAAVTQGEKP